jgi:CRISPR-associated protein Cas1
MIKRTLFFGSATYLSTQNEQLLIEYPAEENKDKLHIPIEDIGLVVMDHAQIRYSQRVVSLLVENNAAVLWCDHKHLPIGLVLNIQGSHTFTESLRTQIDCSEPLKKQLWKQTVQQKIMNQAFVLEQMGHDGTPLRKMADKVNSGDTENMEGRAAARYWDLLLRPYHVTRGQEEPMPNAFFNYGYAILRAITARSLVASGMLPALGIHHRNKYNSYCLADDVMEPYRPLVDLHILQWIQDTPLPPALRTADKATLLEIPTIDTVIEDKKSPLMNAMQRSTAGLLACMEGSKRRIPYPIL